MHESGLIEGRVSGKQIVYHVIQACVLTRPLEIRC
jgi:hypothetical protein